MIFDNVVNDDGEPIHPKSDYIIKTYLILKNNLPNFQDYLFIEYDCDNLEVPATRFYPHDKKILMWRSGEKKIQQIQSIKNDFYHVFANYYWDETNVTSIPLGYYNYFQDNEIPVNERLYNTNGTSPKTHDGDEEHKEMKPTLVRKSNTKDLRPESIGGNHGISLFLLGWFKGFECV